MDLLREQIAEEKQEICEGISTKGVPRRDDKQSS